jgi:hypothetical protein
MVFGVLQEDLLFPYERRVLETDDFVLFHFQAPIQSIVAATCHGLFVDVKHDDNHALHLFNLVMWVEELEESVVVAQTRMSSLTEECYQEAFVVFFKTIERDAELVNTFLSRLEMIMMDFFIAQRNGLLYALVHLLGSVEGKETFLRLLRGCKIHYMRSVIRISRLVTSTLTEQETFNSVCGRIDSLKSLEEARQFFDGIVMLYPGVTKWVSIFDFFNLHWQASWWKKDDVLSMIIPALSKNVNWYEHDGTSNTVGCLNRVTGLLMNKNLVLEIRNMFVQVVRKLLEKTVGMFCSHMF